MPDADRREPIVTLTDAPTAEEERAVGAGLAGYNEQQSGIRDSRPLAVVVRDPQTKQPVGGLMGRTSLGLLFIDLFFLPDNLRGDGLGSRLLRLPGEGGRGGGPGGAVPFSVTLPTPRV